MKIKRTQIHFHGTLSSPSRRRRILSPVHTYPFFFESGIFFLQLNLAVRSHVSGENGFLVQLKRKSPGPTVYYSKQCDYSANRSRTTKTLNNVT